MVLTTEEISCLTSCSQNRRIFHPSDSNVCFTALSRSRFRWSFCLQKPALVRGIAWCWGLPCQKHPSTNTGRPKVLVRTSPTTRLTRVRNRAGHGIKESAPGAFGYAYNPAASPNELTVFGLPVTTTAAGGRGGRGAACNAAHPTLFGPGITRC